MIKTSLTLVRVLPIFLAHILSAGLATGMVVVAIKDSGVEVPLHWALAGFFVAYCAFAGITYYLVMRNGCWGIDAQCIYRGWGLRPFIPVAEITGVRMGLPQGLETVFEHVPKMGGSARAIAAQRESTLVFRLTEGRYFLWNFHFLNNTPAFIQAALRLPVETDFEIPKEDAAKLFAGNVGRIIHTKVK